ncbi:DUF4180 domain-containing protein [Frateuria sp. MAH-13]|uniref:DUF4180 domain-containing protein n=1 Tax=Frateuria flava TaxID=2821489 RepID=A0ABS4DJU0_9GAMM|nr:DUF4180 domain-containing protein [Frateuria flava]MBP1473323.1 DUF4180 domain-containing protein [Frateuria flava]
MQVELIERDGLRVAHILATRVSLRSRQDALDAMFSGGYDDVDAIVLQASCLHRDFFSLPTGVAGEITQTFANYRLRLAVVLDVDLEPGANLRAFMAESNRGRQLCFAADLDAAMRVLAGPSAPGLPA